MFSLYNLSIQYVILKSSMRPKTKNGITHCRGVCLKREPERKVTAARGQRYRFPGQKGVCVCVCQSMCPCWAFVDQENQGLL